MLLYADTRASISVAALLALVACGAPDNDFAAIAEPVEIESPAGPGSGEPELARDGTGVYMTWLEGVEGDAHELRLARFDGASWSEPSVVERSDRFFVNWADFPSITVAADGRLWAHWLERGGVGTYDYAVRVVHSDDGGARWSEPTTLHDDDSPTEHGFVSTFPSGRDVGFVWLDGRRYADDDPQMTLRARVLGSESGAGDELLVDERVCDCCQTAAAVTPSGPVVAYRDRSEAEIRDIYVTRHVDGSWQAGTSVHDDGWEIAGCPVNGPAIAASGEQVAVAWFTGAGNVARTKVAFSDDGGATFGAPIVVDDGNPEGRVDLLFSEPGTVVVSWLERTGGDGADLRVRRVTRDGGSGPSTTVVHASSSRATGFPRMTLLPSGDVLMAWTDATPDAPRVRITRLAL